MFYDLNVPWTANEVDIQRTLAFLAELGYDVVALSYSLNSKLPTDLACPIPNPLPFKTPPKLRILRRCTLTVTDTSVNHRLASIAAAYDILALRPSTEKALLQACQSLECDLISLDLSTRFPFHFRFKTLSLALQRGIKLEICYAPGISASDGGLARRNLISNATELIRATRGRGLIISSEASKALACRAPWDVVNLAAVWGLGQERGVEAVNREARSVVIQADMKRKSYKGVVEVIYGGERPAALDQEAGAKANGAAQKSKRKADFIENEADQDEELVKPMSKREKKRQANKARLEGKKTSGDAAK